jgi:hypothetical protein
MSTVVTWGDFEVHLDRPLGRGGMGTVYRARQISLDRPVAIKVLDPSRAPEGALRQGFLEKFRLEIRALSRLNDSRIVAIYQAGENEGRLWFAMELVEGRTLDQRLSEEGALPEPDARGIATELARALDAALPQGIIHRDVKPANVFLGKDGTVKLGDFGLARSGDFARTPITEANALACTPAYASPEQAEGRSCDHRSDLYSLGAVLYEMVTERPPFQANSPLETLQRLASAQPTSVRLLNPNVSPHLEHIIARCLDKDPERRYQTYGSLLQDLELRPELPRGQWLLPTAAAAGLALLGAILAAIFMGEPPAPPPTPVVVREEVLVPLPAPAAPDPAPPPKEVPPPALERPSKRELEMAERLLALSRESLETRTCYEFERARARLASFVKKESPSAWVGRLAEAEDERLQAAEQLERALPRDMRLSIMLRSGRVVAGTLVSENRDELVVEVSGGLRESLPRRAIAPATYGQHSLLARVGAGDAQGILPHLGKLDERHAVGIVDQAIEEALRGDLQSLSSFEVPRELRESLEPLLGPRFRLIEEESAAAKLHLSGNFSKLLLEKPATRAGERAALTILDDFRRSIPDDPDLELVGEIPWGTWETAGQVRFDSGTRSYVLFAAKPEHRAWIRKPFRGACKGFELRLRLKPDPARLSVALSLNRWFEISGESFLLFGAEAHAEPAIERRVDLGARWTGGTVTVVPREPLVLVYLDRRLVAALPDREFALGEGMQVGAGGGSVILESIRVKDRSR